LNATFQPQTNTPKRAFARSGEALLLTIAVVWAVNISSTNYALGHGFSPLLYAASRNAVGGVALAGIVFCKEKSLAVQLRDMPAVLGAALLGITVNQLCLTYSLHYSGAVVASLVFGMGPIATSLIAWLARSERLRPWGWAAAVVSSAGVAFVALGAAGPGRDTLLGAAIALGATVSWAAYSVILMSVSVRYSALRLNAVMIVAGSLPLVLITAPSLGAVSWSSITPFAWGCWVYGTAISYTVGSIAWTEGVWLVGASRAALYNNAQPFLGAILAGLLFSEGLTLVQALGGAMVAMGVVAAVVSARHEKGSGASGATVRVVVTARDVQNEGD
jgi:drug/metabolite transporter (DMT)-like permease